MPGATVAELIAVLRAETGEFTAGMAKADAAVVSSQEKLGNFAKFGKAALLGLSAVAVGVAVVSIHAADEWEAAHVRLEKAIENTHGSYKDFAGTISKVEQQQERFGFTNAEVENSVARLTPAVGGAEKALNLMGLAADIARGRHMDLESATQLLVKVETGHVGLLGRLGINVKDATGAIISQEEAIKRLSATYGGNASAYAETFSGKMQALKARAEDLAKDVGLVLIPVIMKLGDILVTGANFFAQNQAAAIALAIVIGGPLVASMVAYLVKQADVIGSKIIDFWTAQAKTLGSLITTMWEFVTVSSGHVTATAAEVAANIEFDASLAALTEAHANLAVATQALAAAEYEAATGGMAEEAALAEVAAAEQAVTEATVELVVAQDAMAASSVAVAGGTVAMEGAFATAGMSVIGFAAAIAAPVIAITALVAVIGELTGTTGGGAFQAVTDAMAKGEAQGKHWADGIVEQARVLGATQDAVNLLKLRLVDLKGEQAAEVEAFHNGKLSAEEAAQAHGRYEAAAKILRTELGATKDQVEKYNLSVKQVTATVVASANVLGVLLPSNLGKDKQAITDLSKGITDAVPVFGAFAVQTLVDLGETGKGLTDLATRVTDFAKTVGNAIDSATDPFSHFASATSVSEADLEKFWVDSMNNANDWAAELQDLVKQGLDQGLVQQIAAAGPAAKPALDAFVEMVQKWGGVDAVNAFNAAGKAARDALVKQMAQMSVDVALEVARIQQDMIDHPVELYFKLNQASIATALAPLIGGTANIPVPFGQTGGTDTPGYVPTPHYLPDGTYVGTFGTGGVVPGVSGRPYLATVHGGETITPAGGVSGHTFNIAAEKPFETAAEIVRRLRAESFIGGMG